MYNEVNYVISVERITLKDPPVAGLSKSPVGILTVFSLTVFEPQQRGVIGPSDSLAVPADL